MMPTKIQKFHLGDLVEVHKGGILVPAGSQAYILYSYADRYNIPASTDTYGIFVLLPGLGKSGYAISWFYDTDLRLIKKRTLGSILKAERLNRGEEQ